MENLTQDNLDTVAEAVVENNNIEATVEPVTTNEPTASQEPVFAPSNNSGEFDDEPTTLKETPVKPVVKKAVVPVSLKTDVNQVAVLSLSRRMLRSRLLFVAIPGLLLMALGALLWGVLNSTIAEGAMTVGLSLIGAGILIPTAVFLAGHYFVLPRMSQKATDGRAKVHEFVLSETNIEVKQTIIKDSETKAEAATYVWSQVTKILEDNNYYFLLMGTNLAMILDKSAVATSNTVDDLKRLIDSKIVKGLA